MSVPNYTHLKSTHRDFQLWFAKGPVHEPLVYKLTDEDTGRGHLIGSMDYTPVPVLGPPLRIVALGDTLNIYGGDSYVRGGGAAEGHSWGVYRYDGESDHSYLARRGGSMGSGFSVIDDGLTLQFTPTTAAGYTEGIYAIELHLTGATEGNGLTAPLGFGVRFVYVIPKDADGIYTSPVDGIVALSLNGGLDQMGWQSQFRYAFPDDVSDVLTQARQQFIDNQRFACRYETYYDGVQYTWEPDHDFPLGYYSNEILLSGYIDSRTIQQSTNAQEVTFNVAGAQRILGLLKIPTLPKAVPSKVQGEEGEVEQIPTDYIDEKWYDLLLAPIIPDLPDISWIHRHIGMRFSDPLYHFYTRHTNFCDFHDFRLWQQDEDVIEEVMQQEGSAAQWTRQVAEARMGVVWTDRKSKFYIGPDLNLRGADYWASAPGVTTAVIDLDEDLYNGISVQMVQPQIGQVMLRSVDGVKVLSAMIQSRFGKAETDIQQFIRHMRKAIYPAEPGQGARLEKQSIIFFEQPMLDILAERLFKKVNAQYMINLSCALLPGLDIGQSVLLKFYPRSAERYANWLDGKLFYVIGYTMNIKVDGSDWITSYVLAEITDDPTEVEI